MSRLDIVICSLPFIEYYLPPAAPAVLKGHLESRGFTAKSIDFNITVKNKFENNNLPEASAFFQKRYEGLLAKNPKLQKEIDQLIDSWVDQLLKLNPKVIALSVFSVDSRVACELIIERLSKKKHNSKILLGGMGILEDGAETWLETVLDHIDYYIIGEGELALENLLRGNTNFKGINGRVDQITDLSSLGTATYDDYDLTSYETFYKSKDNFKKKVVMITGSRGCVRDCTFCDINTHWPKFTWRSSKSLIQEISRTYETHGIRDFYFTDSLINGNLKVYMQMVEGLAQYNYKTNANITWGGQYIVRKDKNLSKEYFPLTRDSGAYNLALGVESGSDKVLADMRKGITREDLDMFIENFDKHEITCMYYMLLGYPTETEEDFQRTIDVFYDHQKYVASGTISGTTLNTTMAIHKEQPLHTEEGKLFVKDKSLDSNWGWTSLVVPGLDWEERVRRRLVAQDVCDMLKWPTISSDREMAQLNARHTEYLKWKSGSKLQNIEMRPDQSHLS